MIKTWFIIIPAFILITVILFAINFIILLDIELLINYLKQKTKIMLADYCVNDFFESIRIILDSSIGCFEGNFSTIRKELEGEIGKFIERICKTEDFLRKCGLKIYFEKSIIYYNNDGEYVIEIIARAYVEDCEGHFSFERNDKIIRSLNYGDRETVEFLPNNSSYVSLTLYSA